MSDIGRQFGIFVLGAAAGATLGILLAPEKGSKTRDKILRTSSDVKHKFEDELEDLKKNYNRKVDENLEHVKEGVDTMKKKLSV